jgi:hypothetical protein
MGSSRIKKSAGKGEGTTRMAADILAGVGDVGLEGQETADENIMNMPEFDSPSEEALAGGFLKKESPTVGGSYLGGARQNF